MKRYHNLFRQIIMFGLVGVGTLIIDVAITTALYKLAHSPAYLASAVGFMSGFFFNFPINRKKVFRHESADKFSLHVQAGMFIALSVFNLVATSVIVDLLVTHEIVPISIAKVIVTAMIACWNFIILKQIIFSKNQTAEVIG